MTLQPALHKGHTELYVPREYGKKNDTSGKTTQDIRAQNETVETEARKKHSHQSTVKPLCDLIDLIKVWPEQNSDKTFSAINYSRANHAAVRAAQLLASAMYHPSSIYLYTIIKLIKSLY